MKPSCGLATEVLDAAVVALAGRQKTGEWITAQDEMLLYAEDDEDDPGGLQMGSSARLTCY